MTRAQIETLQAARMIAAEGDALDKARTPQQRDGPRGRIIQIVRDERVVIAMARALLAAIATKPEE
jgi:hypothetical protein